MSEDIQSRVSAIFDERANPTSVASGTVALLREVVRTPESAIDIASAIGLAVEMDSSRRNLAAAVLASISEGVILIDGGPNGPHWDAHRLLKGAVIALR